MQTHVTNSQENSSRSAATANTQMQSSEAPALELEDKRPEAIAQRKLQEMANDSPEVSRQRTFQAMANNSPQAKQAVQLQAMADSYSATSPSPLQKKENNTGLPDNLKSGIENLSGYSLDDVNVHYNSDKPAHLKAHAYAQGSDIHLASGQEKHLPHEAWHVVQQKQGRVKATMQMKGEESASPEISSKPEVAQLMLKVGTDLITSGKIINRSERPVGLDVAVKNYTEDDKIKLNEMLRSLTLDSKVHLYSNWDEALGKLNGNKVIINDPKGIEILTSTSELLVWLTSNPISWRNSPREYANHSVLSVAMDILFAKGGKLNASEVWKAVSDSVPGASSQASQASQAKKQPWDEGYWEQVYDRSVREKMPEPGRFRRQMDSKQYAAQVEQIKERIQGCKLVGLHGTSIEKIGSLIREGISTELFGSGRGAGKGKGFYIVPTSGGINKGIEEAVSMWGRFFVAVFLPNSCTLVNARAGENVESLEKANSGNDNYYRFAEQEAVIPPELCSRAILVCDPRSISVASTSLGAEIDDRRPFEFLKDLF